MIKKYVDSLKTFLYYEGKQRKEIKKCQKKTQKKHGFNIISDALKELSKALKAITLSSIKKDRWKYFWNWSNKK